VKLFDAHTKRRLEQMQTQVMEHENNICKAQQSKWTKKLGRLEKDIERAHKKFELVQKDTEAQKTRMLKQFDQLDADWVERRNEMKAERMEIKNQRKKLLEQEIQEKRAVREKQEYALDMASKVFHADLAGNTLARTKVALDLVYNAMLQLKTNINGLIVMFKEFDERIKHAQLMFDTIKMDMKSSGWDDMANDPEERAFMFKFYYDTVQNVYEGSLGWMSMAKLAYIAMDQMNKIPIYRPTTGEADELQTLFQLYKQIADKSLKRVEQSVKNLECKNDVLNAFSKDQSANKRQLAMIVKNPKCKN